MGPKKDEALKCADCGTDNWPITCECPGCGVALCERCADVESFCPNCRTMADHDALIHEVWEWHRALRARIYDVSRSEGIKHSRSSQKAWDELEDGTFNPETLPEADRAQLIKAIEEHLDERHAHPDDRDNWTTWDKALARRRYELVIAHEMAWIKRVESKK